MVVDVLLHFGKAHVERHVIVQGKIARVGIQRRTCKALPQAQRVQETALPDARAWNEEMAQRPQGWS